ncbi:M23 family metallopeptidase [Specibacter sp. AOP5-B1-6]|uniref:M23 family metallopeptidase n=1 Tax=Specibacter sp. AOP5-B1-6 TaxID=3457653 RepID=UPI003FB960B1
MRVRVGFKFAAAVIAVSLTGAGCTTLGGSGSPPTSDTSAPSPPVSTPADQVSAILVQPIHDAQVVRGSDELGHVEYELLVVNAFSDPVTLTGVTVVDPDGKDLMTVEGDILAAATQTLYTHAASPVVDASAAVVVEVDLPLPSGDKVPERLSNRIEYTLPAGLVGAAIVDDTVVHGPEIVVDRTAATVIAPPLAGDGWLATSACCSPNVHRDLRLSADGIRLATAETFAVDWAQVKGDRVYDGDGSRNELFYDFGANVLAVADGTVVAVHDGVQESTPFKSTAPETKEGYGGNQVMIKIAEGVYAAYAHLQPGSLAVAVGDTVKAGDVVGKLGNTGPSQGPHLHFGLLDKPDLFVGRSLPFVFESFTLVGTVDFASATGDTLAISPESRKLAKAYPLYGTIVDFP